MAVTRDVLEAIHQRRSGPNPGSDLFATVDSFAQTPAESSAGVTPVNYAYAGRLGYDVRRYGADATGGVDVSSAVTAACSANTQVYFAPGTYKVSTNLTLPRGVTFVFDAGAQLSVDTGKTVSIGGQIDAGGYQIFSGLGNVLTQGDYTHGPGVYNVKWWGAKGDNTADDTLAFMAATNGVASGVSQGVLEVPVGQYRILSSTSGGNGIQVGGALSIRGQGFYSVLIGIGFSSSNPILSYIGTSLSPRTNFFVRDLHFLSDNSGAAAMQLAYCNSCDFSNLWLDTLATGVLCGTNIFSNTWKLWHAGGVSGRNFIVSNGGFNNNVFLGGRFGGGGFLMNHSAGLNAGNVFYGVDFEGLASATAGVYIAPTSTGTVRQLAFLGCYAENGSTPLFYLNGPAANSIRGVTVIGCYLNGQNAGATSAIIAMNVNGICVRGNDFDTWSQYVINDLGGNSNWDIGPNDSTAIGTSFSNTQLTGITVAYSASMTLDASLGTDFVIVATNGTAFTINAPTNALPNQRIRVSVANSSGGALGAVTWNAAFKMSAWTQPANGNQRSIEFKYNGTNWYQIDQTGVDVPN